MRQASNAPEPGQRYQVLRLALLGVIGQVGCLTLVIVVAALAAGLWLDSRLDTRPLFALIFVLGSVPLTLYLMVRIVLGAAPRLQLHPLAEAASIAVQEESDGAVPSDRGS